MKVDWESVLNTMSNLVQIQFDNFSLNISIGPIFLLLVIIFCIAKANNIKFLKRWNIKKIALLNGIEIAPNKDVNKVAHEAWTELKTRKIGLPYEDDLDVIVEVYDSWYVAFSEIRKLIKRIPSEKINKDSNIKLLVDSLISVLNETIRPHLTKWQAKFRKWYQEELEEDDSKGLSPQEIQKKFPFYSDLIQDLKNVNADLVLYCDKLYDIATAD